MAHAAESPAAGPDLRLQHRLDPVAQREIGVADDAGGDPCGTVATAVAHRGDAGDELGFADRTQFLRAVGAVHRMALQEHGGDDVVARSQVREQFVQQVTMIWTVPKVMMRINNRQIRIEDLLPRRLGQPDVVRRVDSSEPGRLPGLGHATSLPIHR